MQTELSSSGFFLPFSGSCPVHKRDSVCPGRTTRSKESQGQPEHVSLPPPAKAYRETSAAKHKMRVRRTVPRGAPLGTAADQARRGHFGAAAEFWHSWQGTDLGMCIRAALRGQGCRRLPKAQLKQSIRQTTGPARTICLLPASPSSAHGHHRVPEARQEAPCTEQSWGQLVLLAQSRAASRPSAPAEMICQRQLQT